MTVENISWSISTKECCQPRRGLNPRPPGLQSDGASNWATEAGASNSVIKVMMYLQWCKFSFLWRPFQGGYLCNKYFKLPWPVPSFITIFFLSLLFIQFFYFFPSTIFLFSVYLSFSIFLFNSILFSVISLVFLSLFILRSKKYRKFKEIWLSPSALTLLSLWHLSESQFLRGTLLKSIFKWQFTQK